MPRLYRSARDAALASTDPGTAFMWVVESEAYGLRLPRPWFEGRSDVVNGERAILFGHPRRLKQLEEWLDRQP